MRFTLPFAALVTLPFVAPFVINDELLSFCKSPVVAEQSYIGNVQLSAIQCANFLPSFSKRQTTPVSNVCGAQCDTHCFNPAGGGPDPNDCNVIADALRYDSQDISEEFNVSTTNALFVLQYHSCESFFVNQAGSTDLTYCRSDWAAVIDFVAFNCQATQNAHGGLCVAASQEWFIQIQPFVNASASASSSVAAATATSSVSTITPTIIPPLTSGITTTAASSTPTSSTSSSTSSASSASSATPSTSTSLSTTSSVSTTTSGGTSTATSTSTDTSASTTATTSVSITTTGATVTTTA
ncbi:hypothetical protein EUX98_g6295 [Antrodiella citrinella]|uniref:Uncharacterized protein n=1 Tax=Antrodiella citrinella TaxID=2447956 RepID=A0A4V3XI52_9APHY|nr:hypothetical protein EUX98_g6295 [Antrodiella citrinella]